jgi:hypothetical protein
MKVYVLTSEPYHDNSTVLGAYSTLQAAKVASGLADREWDDGYDSIDMCVAALTKDDDTDLFIYELEIQ